MFQKKNLKVSQLLLNTGQIDGLPKNPRFIKDERYAALLKSVQDAPEMLDYRTLLVYPYEDKYVIICGNMRYRACKEIGYSELPCCILPADTPVEKLREYTIKDNIAFGSNDWDNLANEWNLDELQGWGMECDFLGGEQTDLDEFWEDDNSEKKDKGIKVVVDVPNELEDKIEDIKKAVELTLQEWNGCKIL